MTGLLVLCLVASAGSQTHAAQKNTPPPQKNAARSQINRAAQINRPARSIAPPRTRAKKSSSSASRPRQAGRRSPSRRHSPRRLPNGAYQCRRPRPRAAAGRRKGQRCRRLASRTRNRRRGFGFPTPAKPPTAGGLFQISLAPARPHTLRVVDAEGRPVPNLKCSVAIVLWSSEDWAEARSGHCPT